MLDLSVVIPSYRPGHRIFQCLDSVFRQDIGSSYEVVVVDSSPEDLGPSLRERYPSVRLIQLPKRALSGRARSIGAAQALGRIVCFTDADCVVDPHWLHRLSDGHRRGYSIVGGSVANGTPKDFIGTTEYLLEFNEMNPSAKPGEVRALPSCNLSVGRHVFDRVGYFPDFLKGEDTIFCERAVASGERILFKPDATITHLNRTDLGHYLKNQIALGEGANETRRRTGRHGSFLIRFPFLIPLIPLYRTWAVGNRLWSSDKRLFLDYLAHYPLVFLGLLFYTWGFIRGPHKAGLSTERSRA